MIPLHAIRFVSGRCQSCKNTLRVFGGPCVICTAPRPEVPLSRPCVMALTATPRSNGRRLRVRCECMSGIDPRRLVDYRTAYDHLGDASNIFEAREIWKHHRGVVV